VEALLIIIPSLSLLSKAFISFAIISFFLLAAFINHKKIFSSASGNYYIRKFRIRKWLNDLMVNIYNFKIEILFFLWCFLSCFWRTNKIYALFELTKLLAAIYIFLKAVQYSSYIIKNKNNNYFKFLYIGITISILVFFIEFYTEGSITLMLRKIFQEKSKQNFHLHFLDRGCVFLSFISWVAIANLTAIRKHLYLKYLCSAFIYSILLFLLYKSDSLSGFLGFLSGGIVYLLLRLLLIIFKPKFILNLIPAIIIVANFSIPTFFYKMNTSSIINKYENILPDSAIHRLFIWDYSMKKSTESLESLILGFGFGSSKELVNSESEMIKYKSYNWKPLPIHPHNLLVQIILELGLVGFLIYNIFIYKFIRQIINSYSKNNNLLSFTLGAFANYYFVAMISFGIWQFWWVCTTLFLIFNFKILHQKWVQKNL
jgi:O-antigen ligase